MSHCLGVFLYFTVKKWKERECLFENIFSFYFRTNTMMLLTKLLRQFGKCSRQTWLEPSLCLTASQCLGILRQDIKEGSSYNCKLAALNYFLSWINIVAMKISLSSGLCFNLPYSMLFWTGLKMSSDIQLWCLWQSVLGLEKSKVKKTSLAWCVKFWPCISSFQPTPSPLVAVMLQHWGICITWEWCPLHSAGRVGENGRVKVKD